jgi:glyoxylase-like metal-dependent hydrolase (beta-lactamase superfamily II)
MVSLRMANPLNFQSEHFEVDALTEGVFALVATYGGWGIGNAGLIDLGGQIIAFDTFITPRAAEDLRRFSVAQFGKPPNIVINSHYHNDHIWGNQVFAEDALILSSSRTRELITTKGQEEFDWYSATSAQRLEELQGQYQNASRAEQENLKLWVAYFEGLVEELPRTTIHLPQITFESRFEIHGEHQTAELITFEGGHTGSDSVLYLPENGILFMSDLLFVDCHPYIADGDPQKLLGAVDDLGKFDALDFVPGHGPVGTKADLDLMCEYVTHCVETAQGLVESGQVEEARINEIRPTEKFQHWQLPQFFQMNIQFLCKRLMGE